ncbi:MAG: DUF2085 domain-containing protein [Litorilinea sp.]
MSDPQQPEPRTTDSPRAADSPRAPQPANTPPAQSAQIDSAISRAANNLVLWIARHWLALFTTAWGLYVFLPFLAPILLQGGFTAPATLIYTLYSYACHQLPDHSYFLFGNSLAPNAATLEAAGMPAGPNLFAQRAFVGGADVGYKVALCQRDVAIYGAIFLCGLLFALIRNRLESPSIRVYLLFLIPIALDGGTQLIGLRESNWLLRTLTGALFGAASVWLIYPYVEAAMDEVIETEGARQTTLPPTS